MMRWICWNTYYIERSSNSTPFFYFSPSFDCAFLLGISRKVLWTSQMLRNAELNMSPSWPKLILNAMEFSSVHRQTTLKSNQNSLHHDDAFHKQTNISVGWNQWDHYHFIANAEHITKIIEWKRSIQSSNPFNGNSVEFDLIFAIVRKKNGNEAIDCSH